MPGYFEAQTLTWIWLSQSVDLSRQRGHYNEWEDEEAGSDRKSATNENNDKENNNENDNDNENDNEDGNDNHSPATTLKEHIGIVSLITSYTGHMFGWMPPWRELIVSFFFFF